MTRLAACPTGRHHDRGRPLTEGEWGLVSAGLAEALHRTGATPRLVARAHPAARVAAIWRGAVPVLTRGDMIWWPGVAADLSAPALETQAAVLQHELQHILDYRTGLLSPAKYLLNPRHWRYDWRNDGCVEWATRGAEQRASMAEQLWLIEHGLAPAEDLETLRSQIPWAQR